MNWQIVHHFFQINGQNSKKNSGIQQYIHLPDTYTVLQNSGQWLKRSCTDKIKTPGLTDRLMDWVVKNIISSATCRVAYEILVYDDMIVFDLLTLSFNFLRLVWASVCSTLWPPLGCLFCSLPLDCFWEVSYFYVLPLVSVLKVCLSCWLLKVKWDMLKYGLG